jgi:hypothetical protein
MQKFSFDPDDIVKVLDPVQVPAEWEDTFNPQLSRRAYAIAKGQMFADPTSQAEAIAHKDGSVEEKQKQFDLLIEDFFKWRTAQKVKNRLLDRS